MAKKNTAEVKIKVSDGNTIKATTKKMDGLAASTDKVVNANKGVIGTSGKAGKDFSRMASGMGGLVAAYATVAANLFALSAAFLVLKNSADFDSMIISSKNFADATGTDFINIAKTVQAATGMQISFADSLAISNKALASGIGADQLGQFTELATKAAQSFGGTTTDALNRFVDAVLRGRTELVNKLGIIISADTAFENYGATINKTVQELTDFEKKQAITNAILEKGAETVGATIIDPNPLEVLAVTFKDLAQDIGTFFTATEGIGSQMLSLFNESKVAVGGLATILIGSVLSKLRATDGELKSRRTAARKDGLRSVRAAKRTGQRIAALEKIQNVERLAADTKFTEKRLKVFAQAAEKQTKGKLKGKLKSFDAALEGKILTPSQIKGAFKALDNAEKKIGALQDVPKAVRASFRKELQFMAGDATNAEKKIRRATLGMKSSLESVALGAKNMRNKINTEFKSMTRAFAVAEAKLSRKGLFSKLPDGMNLFVAGAARTKVAFGKLLGAIGPIGIALSVGTAAWEFYRKTFDKQGLALDRIKDKMKEFETRIGSLSETLIGSSKTFNLLIGQDTTASFETRAGIIANNIKSIIALIQSAKAEFTDLKRISALGLEGIAIETQIKELEAKRKAVQALQDGAATGEQRFISEGFGPSGGGSTLVELRKEDLLAEIDAKLKKLGKKESGILDSTEELLVQSTRQTLQVAVNSIKLFEKELVKRFGTNIPEAMKNTIDRLIDIGQTSLDMKLNSEQLGGSIDSLTGGLGTLSAVYGSLENSIKSVAKTSVDFGIEVKKINRESSKLPKNIKLAFDTILSGKIKKELANIRKQLGPKGILADDGSAAAIEELALQLGFTKEEFAILKKEGAAGIEKIELRFNKSRDAVVALSEGLQGVAAELLVIKDATEDLAIARLNNQFNNSDEKVLQLAKDKLQIEEDTLILKREQLQLNINALEKSVIKQIGGSKKALIEQERLLVILNKQKGVLTAKNAITKIDLEVLKRKLAVEKSILVEQEKGLILKAKIDAVAETGGSALATARKAEDRALKQKGKLLDHQEKLIKLEANSDKKAEKLALINFQRENLLLEGELIEKRRIQANFDNAAIAEAAGDNLSAFNQTSIGEQKKAQEIAATSIQKLTTGFAQGIRAGSVALMESIRDGNFKIIDALAEFGRSIIDTMIDVAADQLTDFLLGALGVQSVEDEQLKVQRQIEENTRKGPVAAKATTPEEETGFVASIKEFFGVMGDGISNMFSSGDKAEDTEDTGISIFDSIGSFFSDMFSSDDKVDEQTLLSNISDKFTSGIKVISDEELSKVEAYNVGQELRESTTNTLLQKLIDKPDSLTDMQPGSATFTMSREDKSKDSVLDVDTEGLETASGKSKDAMMANTKTGLAQIAKGSEMITGLTDLGIIQEDSKVATALNTVTMIIQTATMVAQMTADAAAGIASIFGANGGVASTKGFTPLANGGVATQAQPFIIGEGRKNEAVVPLPNNREIPVVMKNEQPQTIVTNNYDFSGADAASEARIRGMIQENGKDTFNQVFKQIDRGGTFAKKAGRR